MAEQKQNTILKTAETSRRTAVWAAEKELAVSKIKHQNLIERKTSQLQIAKLEDGMYWNRTMHETNAWLCMYNFFIFYLYFVFSLFV